ncbi:hypothetical protein NIIDMKKI_50390 [Mycobacterium kansasii]|uniref:Polyketide synthase C-terminal extension domain-containing protein n=1 Tax=Mycobacterium kansasii TaxID=1768 RepID=A0A7G1II79_MYCKA|nr:hypothetical protein NIIDMKKI_50390 [Mycobacterium kansasii]
MLPPLLHFNRLPDELAGIETGLFVPQAVTPWPNGDDHAPKRVAVSSFGMSGTNVHAILEQAPPPAQAPAAVSAPAAEAGGPLLFPISSSSTEGLRQTARRLAEWVEDHQDSVVASDVAYTLARRRAHRPVRTAVVASGLPELVQGLREVADGELPYEAAVGQGDRGPVWVFSGQGSQWAAMGVDLLASEPVSPPPSQRSSRSLPKNRAFRLPRP